MLQLQLPPDAHVDVLVAGDELGVLLHFVGDLVGADALADRLVLVLNAAGA